MGLLGQLLGLGFVSPSFYALSLITRNSSWDTSDFNVAEEVLWTIPISVTIGLGGSWALAALPAPTILSLNQKVNLVRLWEVFPCLIYVTQRVLAPLTRLILKWTGQHDGQRHQALHYAYAFGLFWSTVTYWYSLAMVLTATVFPSVFTPEVANVWNLRLIYGLTNPFALGNPLPSIAEGQLWFVQWDYWLISVACFVWALSLRLDLVTASATLLGLKAIVQGLFYALVLGPVGAAVVMTWERDTLLLKHHDLHKKKA